MSGDARTRATVPEAPGEPEAPVTLGHFALGRRLGAGGMGVVFEARDTVLDRTVALKLVRPDAALRGDDKARSRLVREAQALARLKHPNVVTVFEVGTASGEIFIAMERVEGETLRDWMRTPRGWREVVEIFAAVGRGLAAAHALGLVHRDIKPSNVFLDRDGTPKVGDFGLVSSTAGGDDSTEESPPRSIDDSAPVDRSLTSTGSVMGTPAYMAPEQVHGERVDARADQYSFCVSMFEALTGRLPTLRITGMSTAEAGEAPTIPQDTGGVPTDAASDARAARPIPPRLRAIVARGLADDVRARYPSMNALLLDLARVQRGHARAWLAAGGAAAAIAIAGGAWSLARASSADDPCPAPVAQLDAVWGDARRAAVRAHVLAIDPAEGQARFTAAAAQVDPYVHAWSDMYVGACRATRVRGGQSDTLLDLRMRCLDHRLALLDADVGLVAGAATPSALDPAIKDLLEIAPLDGCADDNALGTIVPPPSNFSERIRADVIERQIVLSVTRRHAGRFAGLVAADARVVADARALGHAPTLGDALAELAQVQLNLEDSEAAVAVLRELTQVAARAHDDRQEANAWIKLIGVVGTDQAKPTEALALAPAASAAVLRAGEPLDLRVDLLYAQAEILDQGPRPAEGLAKLEQARVLLTQSGADHQDELGTKYADVLFEIAGARQNLGDVDGAIEGYHRAIDQYRRLFGPDSLDEAYPWHNLAETLRLADRYDEAEAAARAEVHIQEARLGPSVRLALSLSLLSQIESDAGRWNDALPIAKRSLDMVRAQVPPDDPQLIIPMFQTANILDHLEQRDDADRMYSDVIAMFDRRDARNTNLALALADRGDVRTMLHRCADAIPDFERAIAVFEELRGKDYGTLAYPLIGEARCLRGLGRAADAIPLLRRAVALHDAHVDAEATTLARVQLDLALVESGVDPHARADVPAARAALVTAGGSAGDVHEIDVWLAKHH